jgi:hypothetical protein
MNNDMENGDMIKEELASILEIYYNGSFAELTCDYICHMGITVQEVERILEEIRKAARKQ